MFDDFKVSSATYLQLGTRTWHGIFLLLPKMDDDIFCQFSGIIDQIQIRRIFDVRPGASRIHQNRSGISRFWLLWVRVRLSPCFPAVDHHLGKNLFELTQWFSYWSDWSLLLKDTSENMSSRRHRKVVLFENVWIQESIANTDFRSRLQPLHGYSSQGLLWWAMHPLPLEHSMPLRHVHSFWNASHNPFRVLATANVLPVLPIDFRDANVLKSTTRFPVIHHRDVIFDTFRLFPARFFAFSQR